MNTRTFFHKSPEARQKLKIAFACFVIVVIAMLIFVYFNGAALALLPVAATPVVADHKKDAINMLSNLEVELNGMEWSGDVELALTLILKARGSIVCNDLPAAIEALSTAQDRLFDAQISTRIPVQGVIEKLHEELRAK